MDLYSNLPPTKGSPAAMVDSVRPPVSQGTAATAWSLSKQSMLPQNLKRKLAASAPAAKVMPAISAPVQQNGPTDEPPPAKVARRDDPVPKEATRTACTSLSTTAECPQSHGRLSVAPASAPLRASHVGVSSSSFMHPIPVKSLHSPPAPSPVSDYAEWRVPCEYDPFKPNDYTEELASRRARRAERRAGREAERIGRLAAAGAYGVTGVGVQVPALTGSHGAPSPATGRGRGVDQRPAWMVAAEAEKGEGGGMTGGSVPPSHPSPAPPPPALSVAARVMARMGFDASSGKGLGKDGGGITAPLEHIKTGRTMGIIRAPASYTSSMTPTTAPTSVLQGGRVLLLRNLVDATPGVAQSDPLSDESLDALREDVEAECASFGAVQQVFVYTAYSPGQGSVGSDVVRVFVQFARGEEAARARSALHGRWFGGRTVHAEFFDEGRYARLDLGHTPHDIPCA